MSRIPTPIFGPKFIEILNNALNERQLASADYSLRDFARDISVDSSALSRILRGKQIPTLVIASTMADRLELTSIQRREFFLSIGRVRIQGLVETLSTYLEEPSRIDVVLNELVGEQPAVEPRISATLDIEIYRSLVAHLPGYAAVFSADGDLLLRNELAMAAGLFDSPQALLDSRFDSTAAQISFDTKVELPSSGGAEETELRFSAIRGSDGVILGWLASSTGAALWSITSGTAKMSAEVR